MALQIYFFEFFEITVGFVTMIYFILGALSYVFDWPTLNSNPMIKFIGVLVIFWILALSQFGGTKYTAKIAKIGFIVGILLPADYFNNLSSCIYNSRKPYIYIK